MFNIFSVIAICEPILIDTNSTKLKTHAEGSQDSKLMPNSVVFHFNLKILFPFSEGETVYLQTKFNIFLAPFV